MVPKRSNMCLAPIRIKNPRYGRYSAGHDAYYNVTESSIQVPCGKCPQCIATRQGFFLQRVQMESLRSHIYMVTLTYNNESIPRIHIGDYNLSYPEWSDVQNLMKRLRSRGLVCRYIFVSEYGKKGRPHFHALIALDKSLGDPKSLEVHLRKLILEEWRRNYGSTRSPYYYPLCHYIRKVTRQGIRTNYDCHYVEPIPRHDNDVSFYVSKYVTKYDSRITKLLQKISLDDSITEDERFHLQKTIKPKCTISKDFGYWKDPQVSSYILDCINKTHSPLPQYYDIYTGKALLMTPYYVNHLCPINFLLKKMEYSQEKMYYVNYDHRSLFEVSMDYTDYDRSIELHEQQKKIIFSREIFGD